MRVTYVSPGIAPGFGGIHKDVPGLCREMARRGFEVSLLTTDVGYRGTKIPAGVWAKCDGYRTIYFRHVQLPGRLSNFAIAPGCHRVLRDIVSRTDVVHIYSLYNYLSSWTARYARAAGVPYVVEPHGALDTFLYRRSRYRKRLFEFLWERRNLGKAAAVRCLSRKEAEQAKDNLGLNLKTVVIPTGIDVAKFRPSAAAIRVYDAYGLPQSLEKIVFVGRLHEKKGLDLLAEAFVQLCTTRRSAQLVIVGPDEGVEDQVRQLLKRGGCEQRATFTGMVNGQAKIDLMAAADVIVVPSYTENFGNVVIEAMALARPLVVSSGVGIAEQVSVAKAGLVVNPVVGELVEALEFILTDRRDGVRMGRAGKSLVEREFLWGAVGERMEALYRGLV